MRIWLGTMKMTISVQLSRSGGDYLDEEIRKKVPTETHTARAT